jgi:uncharacterized protein YcgI (DUF1989 family)
VRLHLRLNDQQLAAIARVSDGAAIGELVARGIEHDRRRPPDPRRAGVRPPGREPSPGAGAGRADAAPGSPLDQLVPAGTGLGVALRAGDVVRVEQVVEGQCADLNAFALGADGQRFDAARTRAGHGLRVTTGAVLWSTPPEVALAEIVADSSGPHDLCFPACSAAELGELSGRPDHSNCVDLQRETQRHWGLEPSAAHDPLNLWLPTDVLPDGRLCYWPAACRIGDFVELRALRDVLIVVNPCASDLFGSAQWELGPVRAIVRRADPDREPPAHPTGPPPRWRWRDLPVHEIPVEIPDALGAHLVAVRERGWLGDTDADVARALLLRWWEQAVGIPTEISR